MKIFIADTHFYHDKIAHIRGFRNSQEMNNIIISNIGDNVKRGDHLYIIGDFVVGNREERESIIQQLKEFGISLHLILGNHDHIGSEEATNFETVDQIKIIKISGGQKVVLCHYPMVVWEASHRGAWLLYGHLHKGPIWEAATKIITGKALNVNCEFHDYKPLSEDDIVEMMKQKEENFDCVVMKKCY